MLLSLLDRSRTRDGSSDATALHATIDRAVNAEKLGYHRFWVAEHHGVPGIASGAPPVLLAAIGARTSSIRIGSGGVMLPNHQPFVVAEQFAMLEALYPGRVDAGVGRSVGFTEPVRRALRTVAADTFIDDLAELRSYLDSTGPVTVRPAVPSPPVYVLATGQGLAVAAEAGLPVVVGGPILHGDGSAIDDYRRRFRPTERNPAPTVIVSLDITVAETASRARELVLPEAWAMAQSRRTGEFPPLTPASNIDLDAAPTRVRDRVEKSIATGVHGTPEMVVAQLDRLSDRTGADEILASTSTYDREALFDADAALMDLVQASLSS
ncbi:MsnO8 family LLM class oxidoreductase [Rhodococcus sp. BP-252]|uniref:MsnO8 family LLM class oxidoreductase n=1 Tax=unclassified Rhodococcus (in: high G+C Gram-positive bacteria) TaxID=192944 RepID=UPI001C9B6456|nr:MULTISPECIES: MsnO8 family LLM class oxidoreductase [unclassified Rhodococcus (in: high G+C Gram-positive bacteria)]MBY6413538.1 MsnO8 family LLM class oxidoreductase [Rhodococcus sp. BP-320]MBY6418266.1 MsnO8 family LLM class oxidoreductase [Rhodococcus sp. BP-321]MBY6422680.1 MsnO8 family LLM class oxidoreductase [Rhodococcus sp. BP-324]MBY6428211.1 MsnO8 family LLM class oxidoreductase [Rhodococcus sp. BP-323]MBY6433389.1 MsnO8 family LLM class oxidoreductase [Rhodococcus sp. BP-322]